MSLSKKIRSEFIEYFEKLNHTVVDSSPVVPKDDPTIMFANAGMNQFKDIFLGVGHREYHRAVDTQKCIRVSGKHNDLEEVGSDTYHHTFFEMLGNWSFGDYFKAEAIEWAWKLLTEEWGLPKERLYATVFAGDDGMKLGVDEEALELWKTHTDIDHSHIQTFGQKDNFWQMASTGPCGPCSEIHIDLTPDMSGGKLVNAGDPRVIEIWNLVFMQYNRNDDGSLEPLPAKHVDTGMGFERICRIVKNLDLLKNGELGGCSNYGTDLFVPIIKQIEELSGCEYGSNRKYLHDRYDSDDTENVIDIACRVIADHVRAVTFAITDGAMPSNEGRGYVLRRLLRRAARYGRKLDMKEPFIYKLIPTVIEIMGDAFPEIKEKADFVAETIQAEEKSFGRTLDRGIDIFENVAGKLEAEGAKAFSGADAFKLYDTFGFPLDLTQLMARERGLEVDEAEFTRLMDEQRTRARSAEKTGGAKVQVDDNLELPTTDDSLKYGDVAELTQAKIVGWLDGGAFITNGEIKEGRQVDLICDVTPFYAESGGQIGDTGKIFDGKNLFAVEETLKVHGKAVAHRGKVISGSLKAGQCVNMELDAGRRADIMNNHTATHILQWALREVLGDHVKQSGSLVNNEYLRFDFTNNKAMTSEEIAKVEQLVMGKIDAALPAFTQEMEIDKALDMGVTALFGEKYGSSVRVMAIGAKNASEIPQAFSAELCGGTHVKNTSSIMDFKIIREESLQTGVRRITAKTGRGLRTLLHERYEQAIELSQSLKIPADQITARVMSLLEENKKLKKTIQAGPKVDLAGVVQKIFDEAQMIGDSKIVVAELPDAPVNNIREQMDWVKKKAESVVVVFASRNDEKVQLLAAVSDDLVKRGLSAGNIIGKIAKIVGGGGGGRPQMAQAGGKNPAKLPDAIAEAEKIIRETLT